GPAMPARAGRRTCGHDQPPPSGGAGPASSIPSETDHPRPAAQERRRSGPHNEALARLAGSAEIAVFRPTRVRHASRGSLREACNEDLGDINETRALTRPPPAHRAEVVSGPAKPTVPHSQSGRPHILENTHPQELTPEPAMHHRPQADPTRRRAIPAQATGCYRSRPRPRPFTPSELDVATPRTEMADMGATREACT